MHNNDAASSLTLFNTTVQQNTAGVLGGGVYVENGLVSLHDQSRLIGNTAQAGGGLASESGGHPQVFNSTVSDNHATNENGGGLYLKAGSVGGLSGVLLSGNHAEGAGGAIDNEADGISVFGSTLINNRAVFGAALYNAGANVLIGASIIRGNTAGADGGGIYNTGANLQIGTTTLQGNTAVSGGGIDNERERLDPPVPIHRGR